MRVLGIDCGTEYTGYGVVEQTASGDLRSLAAAAGLEVCEYAPLAIKSAVVGYGRAEKSQVQQMVAALLRLPEIPTSPDAADALAIAICHLHTAATLARQQAAAPHAGD